MKVRIDRMTGSSGVVYCGSNIDLRCQLVGMYREGWAPTVPTWSFVMMGVNLLDRGSAECQ
jgi:hypothetical protein